MGCDCRDEGRTSCRRRGRASYGERAACCDPAAPSRPVRRRCPLGWTDPCGHWAEGLWGRLQRASGPSLISRTTTRPRCPYKLSAAPTTALHPSSRHITRALPLHPHIPTNTTFRNSPVLPPPHKHLHNDWRQIRRQGQRLQVQRPVVSSSAFIHESRAPAFHRPALPALVCAFVTRLASV